MCVDGTELGGDPETEKIWYRRNFITLWTGIAEGEIHSKRKILTDEPKSPAAKQELIIGKGLGAHELMVGQL